MRIALFVNVFPALSETFVLNQITGLLDLGHDITVFAGRPGTDAPEHPTVRKYRLHEHTRYLQAPRTCRQAAGAIHHLARFGIRKPSVFLRSLRNTRLGRLGSSVRLLSKASPLLQTDPFDLVHCHFGPVGVNACQYRDLGAISGPIVVTFHGYDVSKTLKLNPNAYRELFAKGDLFLPISNRWRKRLIAHGAPPNRTRVHRMGIELDRFPYHQRTLARNQHPRILTIARLTEKKGVDIGLRAMALLRRRFSGVKYTIAGDGPLRDQLFGLANELGVQDITTFLGWQNQDEVAELMRTNHILLAPSRTASNGDEEGIPVTIMEAMACGLPVISTQHSGIPELVQNQASGILVPENDPTAVAKSIHALVLSSGQFHSIGISARKTIGREYDARQQTTRLAELFQQVVENQRCAPGLRQAHDIRSQH